MWGAKKPAACNRPSGQAKYCLSAPPFYLPLAHLYCQWSHIGTLQSLSTGRGIYGGAIRVISSTGKQWPGLVAFDSVHSTAGMNGAEQNSTPTSQWCLSLSAKVTSNKHCKQRVPLNPGTESKACCLHHFTHSKMPPAQYGQHFRTQHQHQQLGEAHLKSQTCCIIQKENNNHLLHVSWDIYNKQGLAHIQVSLLLSELHVIAATVRAFFASFMYDFIENTLAYYC